MKTATKFLFKRFYLLGFLLFVPQWGFGADCSFGAAGRMLSADPLEYPILNSYLQECITDFGTQYKSTPSGSDLDTKMNMDTSDIDSIISGIDSGRFVSEAEDKPILQKAEKFAGRVLTGCERDPNYIAMKNTGTLGTSSPIGALDFTELCKKISEWTPMTYNHVTAGTASITHTGDPAIDDLISKCADGDKATPMICAEACHKARHSGVCDTLGLGRLDRDFAKRAMACFENPRTADCNACELNSHASATCSVAAAKTGTGDEGTGEGGSGGGDVTSASTDPGGDSTRQQVEDQANQLGDLANQVGNRIFGNGNYRRTRANGSLKIPGLRPPNANYRDGTNPPGDPGNIGNYQAGPRSNLPATAFLPIPTEGAPGGKRPDGTPPPGAGPRGGGGGGGGGFGGQGAGGQARGKKGRGRSRGRRNKDLQRAAEQSTNAFMNADGGKTNGGGPPKEEMNKYKRKIAENKAKDLLDNGAINANFQRQLNRGTGASQGLQLESSFFPEDVVDVYVEMMNTADLLRGNKGQL